MACTRHRTIVDDSVRVRAKQSERESKGKYVTKTGFYGKFRKVCVCVCAFGGRGKVALKKQSTHRYTTHILYANLNFQITFIVSHCKIHHFIRFMSLCARLQCVCVYLDLCVRCVCCKWKLSKSKTCLCNLRLNAYSLWFNSVALQQYYKRLWKIPFSTSTPQPPVSFPPLA